MVRTSRKPVIPLGAGQFPDDPDFGPPPPKPKRVAVAVRERVGDDLLPVHYGVLGLDLASGKTGWAFVKDGELRAVGTFALPGSAHAEETRVGFLRRRREKLAECLELLIWKYRPDAIAYEWSDMPRFSAAGKMGEYRTAMALGQTEIMLLEALDAYAYAGVVVPVPMTEAKSAATGKRGARKEDVRKAMVVAYGEAVARIGEDEADAVSVVYACTSLPKAQR